MMPSLTNKQKNVHVIYGALFLLRGQIRYFEDCESIVTLNMDMVSSFSQSLEVLHYQNNSLPSKMILVLCTLGFASFVETS